MDRIAIGVRFDSYSDFKSTLKEYEKMSNTVFVKRRTTKMSPLAPKDLQERLLYSEVVLECKHGSIRASKSKGIRPNQKSLKLGCKAFIKLKLTVVNNFSYLVVVKLDLYHTGHVPSIESVSVLPERRRFQVTAKIGALLDCDRVNIRHLKDIIQDEQNVVMFSRDIHNWRSKRRKLDESSDQEKINGLIEKIVQEGGKVEFSKDGDDNFIHFCWQTDPMIKTFQRCSEVLVMDMTHETNTYHFPLVTVLAIDGNGKALPVFHSILNSENELALSRCLESFRASFDKMKASCFFVDKDFAEVEALTSIFPDAGISLCAFHIQKKLQKAFAKFDMEESLSEVLLSFFMMMKDAQGLGEYDFVKAQIEKVAPREVLDYLEANWWNKPDVWANHTKLDTMRLHVNTVGHCESYQSKVKRALNNQQTSLSRAIGFLLELDEQMHRQSNAASAVSANCRRYRAGVSSPVVDAIKGDVAPFAAEHVIKNLAAAEKHDYAITKDAAREGLWVTSERDSSYTTSNDSCSCLFHQNFRLPCRHMFFLRKLTGVPMYEGIPAESQFKLKGANKSASFHHVSSSSACDSKAPASDPVEKKYLVASSITNEIATYLSSLGNRDFARKFNALKSLFSSWQGGEDSDRDDGAGKAPESFFQRVVEEPVGPSSSSEDAGAFSSVKLKRIRVNSGCHGGAT